MSKKSVAFTGVATLIAGIVIGASGGGEPAVAEPQVRTVTETETVTEEVEVEVVPQGCLDAIEAGETIMAEEMPKFADITIGYIDLIQRAAEAGVQMDVAAIETITDEMEDLTAQTGDITTRSKPLIREFKIGREACENAS